MNECNKHQFFDFVEADMSTLRFVLLSILTLGSYPVYWQYALVKRISTDLSSPRIDILKYITFLSVEAWFAYTFEYLPVYLQDFLILPFVVFFVVMQWNIAKDVESLFFSEKNHCKWIYVIFFNFYYTYYLTHKAWQLYSAGCTDVSQEHDA